MEKDVLSMGGVAHPFHFQDYFVFHIEFNIGEIFWMLFLNTWEINDEKKHFQEH